MQDARRTQMVCGNRLGITRARRDALRWTRQENWTAQVRPWRYWARRDGQLAFESEWRRARRDPCGHRDTAWANRRGPARARLQRLFHQPQAARPFPRPFHGCWGEG